jgi:hypothetical protein
MFDWTYVIWSAEHENGVYIAERRLFFELSKKNIQKYSNVHIPFQLIYHLSLSKHFWYT